MPCSLLERLGVAASDAARLNRIARGHPLALMLASAGVAERPDLGLEDAALTRVVEELTRLYLEDVEDALSRRRWKRRRSCDGSPSRCWARCWSEPTAARPAPAAGPSVRRRGSRRPGRARGGAGCGRGLPARHRTRPATAAIAARRGASCEPRCGTRRPAELWRYTADMLYLIDNPVVREAFFPSGASRSPSSRHGPTTPPPSRHRAAPRGREAAALLERWWLALRRRSP